MLEPFTLAAFWVALALVAVVVGTRLKVSLALVEITVGVVAAEVARRTLGTEALGADQPWLRFLASTGAVLLTFLAGAELDPGEMRARWKEVGAVGFVSFLAPFLACVAVARWGLGWDRDASLLAGIAMSTTSMAVLYAVMVETGLNQTPYGRGILGACFVTDLGTVVALGLLFAPFTWRTAVFAGGSFAVWFALPRITPWLARHYAHRTAEFRTRWVLLVALGLGALALWAGSEAVLPAYVSGMVLSRFLAEDPAFRRRLRTLTVGFLSPFYFLRAGTLVSLPALLGAPWVFLALFIGKVGAKILGLYPLVGVWRPQRSERWYYVLLMSTGLTFGTISALYGYSHGIVDQGQYSVLVAVVIASALLPTLVATTWFQPRHLLPGEGAEGRH